MLVFRLLLALIIGAVGGAISLVGFGLIRNGNVLAGVFIVAVGALVLLPPRLDPFIRLAEANQRRYHRRYLKREVARVLRGDDPE